VSDSLVRHIYQHETVIALQGLQVLSPIQQSRLRHVSSDSANARRDEVTCHNIAIFGTVLEIFIVKNWRDLEPNLAVA